VKAWEEITNSAVELRRELHQRPELRWKENETAQTIRRRLDAADIVWRQCAGTGTVAVLAPRASGQHLALRADIDALPIREDTGRPWCSQVAGRMHACGHDGHTAALMAAAWWLKQHEDTLDGPVSLLFQPAEEGGHGARKMLEEGALEGVDAIFGWHNWPALPFGQAVCPDGPVMAANGTFEIELLGEGGHASQPESCADPVLAASAVNLALQQVVSRRLPPQTPAVVSATSIVAESTETVIPETARMHGSIRVADTALRETVFGLIQEIAEHTARAYGTRAKVEVKPRYAATVNHPAQAERFRAALNAHLGEGWQGVEMAVPVMASEDFSYYLQGLPGAFALIGAGTPDTPLHNSRYDFNDDLIPVVGRLFSHLVGAPCPG